MPQMNKGGKFIFGKSLIRDDLTIHLPTQALTEYNATVEGKVYLFTGSKVTSCFYAKKSNPKNAHFISISGILSVTRTPRRIA